MRPATSGRRRSRSASSNPIQLDSEAQDLNGNVGYSFNKAVNFSSVPDTAGTRPSITIDAPLPSPDPGGTFTLNQSVPAQFSCSSNVGIASCTGATDGGASIQSGGLLDTSKPGTHTLTVAAEDVAGHASTASVQYVVKFVFGGFDSPVSNPPAVNLVNAGSTVPLKWTLRDAAGNVYANMNAVQTIGVEAGPLSGRPRRPDRTRREIGDRHERRRRRHRRRASTTTGRPTRSGEARAGRCSSTSPTARRQYGELPVQVVQAGLATHASRRSTASAQLVRAQAERLGVGNLRDRGGGVAALERVEHVAHGQAVGDDEHRLPPAARGSSGSART